MPHIGRECSPMADETPAERAKMAELLQEIGGHLFHDSPIGTMSDMTINLI